MLSEAERGGFVPTRFRKSLECPTLRRNSKSPRDLRFAYWQWLSSAISGCLAIAAAQFQHTGSRILTGALPAPAGVAAADGGVRTGDFQTNMRGRLSRGPI